MAKLVYHTRSFSYGGFCLTVSSQVETTLDWLSEFLAPSFSEIPTPESGWRINFDTSPLLPQELALFERAAENPSVGSVDFFSLEGRYQQLQLLRDDSSNDCYIDNEMQVYCTFEPTQRVAVVRPQFPDDAPARYFLMKLVREFAAVATTCRGWIPVHGAAVQIEGKGIVVSGPKRAGKSTELVAALSYEHASFVANDRVYLGVERNAASGKLHARGLPTILKLRAETLALFPELVERISECGFHARKRIAECVPAPNVWSDILRIGSRSLSSMQLIIALGAEGRAVTELTALVFLQPAESTSKQFSRLSAEEAEKCIRENLLCEPNGSGIPRAFQQIAHMSGPIVPFDDSVRRVATEVPCFRYQVQRIEGVNEELDREFWSVLKDQLL